MQVRKLVESDISDIHLDPLVDGSTTWRAVHRSISYFLSTGVLFEVLRSPVCVRVLLCDSNISVDKWFGSAHYISNLEVIRLLITRLEIPQKYIEAEYLNACVEGNGRLVKIFLELAPPSVAFLEGELLRACAAGHTQVVWNILRDSRVDPSIQDNQALISACKHYKTKILKMLLKDSRVDPIARGRQALHLAVARGYSRTLGMLLRDPRYIR